MDGVGADLPDSIEPGVVGLKEPLVLPVPVDRDRCGGQQRQRSGGVGGEFQPHEPECGVAEKELPEVGRLQSELMDRMVPGRRAERFRNRFAEGHFERKPLLVEIAEGQRQLAVEFDSEVEDHFAAGCENAGIRIEMAETLQLQFEQHPAVFGGDCADDPAGRNVAADLVVGLHAGIVQFSIGVQHE